MKEGFALQKNDPCVRAVLLALSEALELSSEVSLNDVTASKRCKNLLSYRSVKRLNI